MYNPRRSASDEERQNKIDSLHRKMQESLEREETKRKAQEYAREAEIESYIAQLS